MTKCAIITSSCLVPGVTLLLIQLLSLSERGDACRWFAQWKERHQIRFTFGEWARVCDNEHTVQGSESEERWRVPQLAVPSPYSHRMQRVPTTGDHEAARYYFPPCEEDSQLWLCAYPKSFETSR